MKDLQIFLSQNTFSKSSKIIAFSVFGDVIEITVQARSFLHHKVRNIVGTLSLVGEGKWTSADVEAALAAKSRPAGGPTAPPEGLYLTAVLYPE